MVCMIERGVPVELTLTIPDDLATRLRPFESQLPQLLELGIREWNARQEPGFDGLTGVLETLATRPAPEEVLALRPRRLCRRGLMSCWKRIGRPACSPTRSANGSVTCTWSTWCVWPRLGPPSASRGNKAP